MLLLKTSYSILKYLSSNAMSRFDLESDSKMSLFDTKSDTIHLENHIEISSVGRK